MNKCKCGADINQPSSNPNVHYGNPVTTCDRCEHEEQLPKGSWLQDKSGKYYQKD